MRNMSSNFKHYEHSKILKQTYICPICFNTKEVETEIIGATEDDDTRVHHVEYNAYCRDCDSYMFDCDNKLVDVIVALNKLGLTTEYCCIGHSKHEEFYVCVDMDCCMPYVSFEKDISGVINKVKKKMAKKERKASKDGKGKHEREFKSKSKFSSKYRDRIVSIREADKKAKVKSEQRTKNKKNKQEKAKKSPQEIREEMLKQLEHSKLKDNK